MPHIMIVEDESAIADTLIYALQREGFSVDWLNLGHALPAAMAQQAPHLVILDIGLPDCSGFELCKEIRKTHDVPIIFLTARAEEIDRIIGLEIGADDYVTKPFSPREVVARVKAILKRSTIHLTHQQASQTADQTQGMPIFQHNPDAMQIHYYGQALDLTRYEYRLLALLMAHPQRVYSRAQLMDLVWEDAEDSFERTVDAHIKTLRAKLRLIHAAHDPIITHRGMGYSFKS